MDRERTRLAELAISEESRRTVEASLAAGTSGAGFVVLQVGLSALAIVLLAGSLGVAIFAATTALGGQPAAWRIVGVSLLFASPIALFLIIQIPFLQRLRRGR